MYFPVAQMVKNLPTKQETQIQSLGQEDPLEKGIATHSSIPGVRGVWWATVHGMAKSQTRLINEHYYLVRVSGLPCIRVYLLMNRGLYSNSRSTGQT